MLQELQKPPSESLFEDQTSLVVQRLRIAVSRVMESMPAAAKLGASELAVELGIDKTLAWRILRTISAGDPFSAARHVPGTAAFQAFLRAAQQHGAAKGAIAAAKSGFHGFRELIEDHAGSRKAFDLMLTGHTVQERQRGDLECRRQTYEWGSYIWGAQARATLELRVLAPSVDPHLYDIAVIRGLIDFRWMRPNVPWRIASAYSTDNLGAIHTEFIREPLTALERPEGVPAGLDLMPEFCSRPLPGCRLIDRQQGPREYELVEGTVGNTGMLTCVTGELIRGIEPRYRTERYLELHQNWVMRTPTELAVFDIVIHRDLFQPRSKPEFALCSDLFASNVLPRYRECDKLPVQETIELVGSAGKPPETPEISNYPAIVRHAFDRSGWDAEHFDIYRVAVPYPPIPSTLAITHPLHERPTN